MSGETARQNGKLGGRPKGSKSNHTLMAEQGRAYIIQRVHAELKPIMDKALEQLKAGDQPSRKDLFDRAYGKPIETVKVEGDITLKLDE